jgi:hypothetical protein
MHSSVFEIVLNQWFSFFGESLSRIKLNSQMSFLHLVSIRNGSSNEQSQELGLEVGAVNSPCVPKSNPTVSQSGKPIESESNFKDAEKRNQLI